MGSSDPAHSGTTSDHERVSRLVRDFVGADGFDGGPVDPEATARFMTGTDKAWHAYRGGETAE